PRLPAPPRPHAAASLPARTAPSPVVLSAVAGVHSRLMGRIASLGATMAVDWEQRVDFARLRTHRLERARRALEESDLGALLLFDPNNIRYVTSTHIGEWARD